MRLRILNLTLAAIGMAIAPGCGSAALAGDFDELVQRVGRVENGAAPEAAPQVSDDAVARRKDLLIRAGVAQKLVFKPSPTTPFPLAMCRLTKDPADAKALDYIPIGLAYRGKDNTFGKCMLSRLYYQFRDSLSAETVAAIRKEATTYDGFLSGGTENHIAMRRIAGLLFGEAFPKDTFHYGLTGEQLAAECRAYMRRYGRTIFHNSMVEYLSPGYLAVNTSGWINAAELSRNDESRLLGRAVLDWMIADLALNSHSGQILPPVTRDKGLMKEEYQLSHPRQTAQWNAWLYWGGCTIPEDDTALSAPDFMGNLGSGFNMVHAVSSWSPHPVIRNIGAKNVQTPFTIWQSRSNWEVIEPTQINDYGKKDFAHKNAPNPRYNMRSVYVDRDYAIGAGYRHANIMDPITRHATSFGVVWRSAQPRNRLWAVHPYWFTDRKDETTGKPWGRDDWNGTSPFCQMAHWENAAVLLYDIPARDPHEGPLGVGSPLEVSERTKDCLQEIHVYVPTTVNEKTETPAAWFVREGDVYIAIRPLRGRAKLEKSGHEGYDRLVIAGGLNGVAIEVGDRRESVDFKKFQEKITAAPLDVSRLETEKRAIYRSTRGHTIDLRYLSEGGLPDAAINGVRLDFARWPICESPYVTCRDGILDMNDGRQGMTIDWSGELPEYAYYELKDGQRAITRHERLVNGALQVETTTLRP